MIRGWVIGLFLLLLTYNASWAEVSNELFPAETDKSTYRILFIGTSQTWGAGAKTKEETFVKLLEKRLNNQIVGPDKFVCINTGASGSNSTQLLKYYRNHWLKLSPKITIINLSSNDIDPDIFYANLQQFVSLNKQNNIKTAFMLEANSFEECWEETPLHKIDNRTAKTPG